MNIEFKDNEDFDIAKTINHLMSYWYKELNKKPPTLEEFTPNLNVKQIKDKTKWYHRLVPDIIWNKFMIKTEYMFKDVVPIDSLDDVMLFSKQFSIEIESVDETPELEDKFKSNIWEVKIAGSHWTGDVYCYLIIKDLFKYGKNKVQQVIDEFLDMLETNNLSTDIIEIEDTLAH